MSKIATGWVKSSADRAAAMMEPGSFRSPSA
jgi:hypothetical protein